MQKDIIEEWQKYPFVGVVLPLIAGIITAEYIDFLLIGSMMYIALAASFLVLTFLVNYTSYSRRFLFGVVLYSFLFLLGGSLSSLKKQALQADLPAAPCLYQAVLMTNPSPKTYSVQCEAYIISCMDSIRQQAVNQPVMLSFSKDSAALSLKVGDTIRYYARTTLPKRNSNPGTFDYASYLHHQGIAVTAYLLQYAWTQYHASPDEIEKGGELPLSIRFVLTFRKARNFLLSSYRDKTVDDEIVAVLSALTLGDVSGLPQQLKDDYSVAGASHILALSGSHLAVIYAALDMLFALFLYRWKTGRLIGKLSIVIFIWGFVFLAGAQPSVVRAAVMYTLLVGASLFSRRSLSLNSLSAAAFFMLLFDPFSLFDVGFQLSFLAVLGIIVFNAALYRRLRTSNRIVNYIISILTVSVSVQLISFPLVLSYFSSFPLYFLLTNLLVIPVSSLILMMALAGFFFHFVFIGSLLSDWIIKGLYWLVQLQNEGVKLIASLPQSSLYLPGVTTWIAVWLYGMMLFLLLKGYLRSLRRWYAGLLLVLLGVGLVAYTRISKSREHYLVFYENRHCPAVHLVKGDRKGVLFPAWKDSVSNGMAYLATASWRPSGIPYPEVIAPKDGILKLPVGTILLLNDFHWVNQRLKERMNIDYVWICRGFYGSLSSTLTSFSVRMVVLDASLSEKYRDNYRQECLRLHIPFHDMAENGAYKVILKSEM